MIFAEAHLLTSFWAAFSVSLPWFGTSFVMAGLSAGGVLELAEANACFRYQERSRPFGKGGKLIFSASLSNGSGSSRLRKTRLAKERDQVAAEVAPKARLTTEKFNAYVFFDANRPDQRTRCGSERVPAISHRQDRRR
ncbi:hypothetical protein [Leisingera sp. ANG59]|uniref:hypothetical protein n=1 Tax=Leisingera sp. ANG59 TaxID=2675221 RepID=UPI001572C727|nr:hypothetical protein [Leisingera sp. ANG59]NSY37579.1 hypothetical protein [Leisingera sp. ANG59]